MTSLKNYQQTCWLAQGNSCSTASNIPDVLSQASSFICFSLYNSLPETWALSCRQLCCLDPEIFCRDIEMHKTAPYIVQIDSFSPFISSSTSANLYILLRKKVPLSSMISHATGYRTVISPFWEFCISDYMLEEHIIHLITTNGKKPLMA